MQAIIHVGDRKTGSTSIQTFLDTNQNLLEERGILASRATRSGLYHSLLTSYALDDMRMGANPRREWGITKTAQLPGHRADVERKIADEATAAGPNIHTVLFSHEGLFSLTDGEIGRLMTLLRPHFSQFRIVVYIRRQDRHRTSQWGQRIKAGRLPPKNFFQRLRRERAYLEKLDNWERAVPRENLSVRLFEPKTLLNGCLYQDFCAAAGILWHPGFVQPKAVNPGLNRVAQAFLLALNARAAARNEAPALRTEANRFLECHFAGEGAKPPRAWAQQIMEFFAPQNEEIRRRYFPNRPVLFEDDFEAFPEDGSPECTAQEAFDLAVTMWQLFRQGPTEAEIQEAFRLVLGRTASAEEIAQHSNDVASIKDLYVRLLTAEQYRGSQTSRVVRTPKYAA